MHKGNFVDEEEIAQLSESLAQATGHLGKARDVLTNTLENIEPAPRL